MNPYLKYDLVPDLALKDEQGHPRPLRDYKGRNLVLVLYESITDPETKKALSGFHDRLNAFRDEHAEIVAVASDAVDVNRRYRGREGLPFTFLSDPDAHLARQVGAFDRRDHRVAWTTIIVDRDGRIAHRIQDHEPHGHAGRALRQVQELDAIEEWSATAAVPT